MGDGARHVDVKRSLALLGLAGLLPIIVLASGYAISALHAERESLRRRADILNQFSAALLSRELASQMRSVRMVTQSPAFDRALDLERFELLATRLTQDEPTWKFLSIVTTDGRRILDVPQGVTSGEGERVVEPGSVQRSIQLRRPVVGDIVSGPRGKPAFAVRAPVVRNDAPVYVVSAVLSADSLRNLMIRDTLPEGWRMLIVDRAGHETLFAGPSESEASQIFRRTIPDTDWAVQVEVPDRLFTRLARQTQAVIVSGAFIALMLFMGLGWLLFRHIKSLRESEAAAVHAHRLEALGRLTGGVAHDLNNLLTPIIGGLDLLKRRVQSDEKALRYIENADMSAERARKLVARLLAFSRRQSLSKEDIDLPVFFEEMKDLLAQSLGPGCRLKLQIQPDTPDVHADRDQLELAIMNLVVNARDAMPQGGEVVLLARRASREEMAPLSSGDYTALLVIDSGLGMDEVTLRKAQEPFFSTKAPGHGTGLGLSMAHGFAEQSGGVLLLASRPGNGTTATIVLPAAPA